MLPLEAIVSMKTVITVAAGEVVYES